MATNPRASSTRRPFVLAVLAGLVVFILLFAGSGIDTQPATCFGIFGHGVPCGGWPAVGAGVAAGAITSLLLWWRDRRP